MKNIYFYVSPEKKFDERYTLMSQAQIDNSLEYWKPEDILIVTNFPFNYRGVKSIVADEKIYCDFPSHGSSLSNKPNVIMYLIENGLTDEINWIHDWDIWQVAPLNMPDFKEYVGLVRYSGKQKIQLGSIFFKPSSYDFFRQVKKTISLYKQNEEEAVNTLLEKNAGSIRERVRIMDPAYNIGMINLKTQLSSTREPIKIVHFPPYIPKYLHKSGSVTPLKLNTLLKEKFAENKKSVKNLLVYISPKKQFNPEHKLMIEVQIDNSLDYWKKEDIILLTNFPYEYHGVKAIEGPDSLINKSYGINERGIINSKINAIIYLIENKIIDSLTWFHDLDSFQLAPLDLPPIEADLGLVCYGIYPENRLFPLGKSFEHRINFGNVFFKPESIDIFKLLLEKMDKDSLYEEDAMTLLLDENTKNIRVRTQIMNQTYNIGMRYVRSNIAIADKPLRIAHFPPHRQEVLRKFSRIVPPKLFGMLNDRFNVPQAIKDLQNLKFINERRDWKPFMEKYNCQKIAEVGVYTGQNFKLMISHNPEIAVAIDHWRDDGVSSRNDLGHTQDRLNQIYGKFKSDVSDKPFVQIYREYTTQAAKHFPDNYFDLIYIDADHTSEGCLGDIEAWFPKLKPGGFFIGDDYNNYTAPLTKVVFGVVEAVNKFSKMQNLKIYELPSHGWATVKRK